MVTTGGAGRLRGIFEGEATVGLGPAELLRRFAATRDEAAFSALVDFHGPMVLATCRRVLADGADADDAFQATFLIFARQARAIQDADRLAPWLHSVARRVAFRARSASLRRRAVEAERSGDLAVLDPPDDARELRAVLDEELSRLPEKYRAPLVLCYLEGLTHDEAAGRLAWPVGTVRSRLAGGRDRLRGRLARRGFAPGALAVLSPATLPSAAVSRALQAATIRLACAGVGSGVATSAAVGLAQGVLTTMFLAKVQTAGLVAVALAATLTAGTTGVVLARQGAAPANAPASSPASQPAQDAAGIPTAPVRSAPAKRELTTAEATSLLETLRAGGQPDDEQRDALIRHLEVARLKSKQQEQMLRRKEEQLHFDGVGATLRIEALIDGGKLSDEERAALINLLEETRAEGKQEAATGGKSPLEVNLELLETTIQLRAAKAQVKALEAELAAIKEPNLHRVENGKKGGVDLRSRRAENPLPPIPPAVAGADSSDQPVAPPTSPQPPAPDAAPASPEGPATPTPPASPTTPATPADIVSGPTTTAVRPMGTTKTTETYTRNAEAPTTPTWTPTRPIPPGGPSLTVNAKSGAYRQTFGDGQVLIVPAEWDRITLIDTKSSHKATYSDPKHITRITPVLDMARNNLALRLAGPQLTQVVAYSKSDGTWSKQDLREPWTGGEVYPFVAADYIQYVVGRSVYMFSPKANRWGVLDLKEPLLMEQGLPPGTLTANDGTIIVTEDDVMHVYHPQTGEWTHVNVKDDR